MPTVNPKILSWARETAGLTPDEAVRKIGLHPARGVPAIDRLAALENGTEDPSRPLLVRMAKHYRRPLLVFYMSAPPRKGDRGKDFRTLPEDYSTTEDALLDALIRDVTARQGMVRAVLEGEDEAEAIRFIGSMRMANGLAAVAASLQQTLNFLLSEFRSQESPEAAFTLLRQCAESIGVFVILVGNLGSYHTAIRLETFRGFALADEIAPFVLINDQDTKSAWSFTLLHELAHLLLGQTGISGSRTEATIEQFCNDVAGEILLPSAELGQLLVDGATDAKVAEARIQEFASNRNLSSSMVAYKLYRAGLISLRNWRQISSAFREPWLAWRVNARAEARSQEGGPNYYVVRRHRLGAGLIRLVHRMTAAGALTTTKAGTILGVKSQNVQMLLGAAGRPDARRTAAA